MNIALMAHDNRKELMVQFCTAYCGILAKHTLCATARTGQQIADATGLTIHRFLSFAHGGGQQIAARINHKFREGVLSIEICCPSSVRRILPHGVLWVRFTRHA